MIQYPISTVVNFCTNDARFLRSCVEEAQKFSQQIIVPVCDRFFDGEAEDYALLEDIYSRYPQCEFIEFAFDREQLYGTFVYLDPAHPDWRHHWHNSGRLIAFYFLKEETKYVFLMDSDEVPDGARIAEWLNHFDYTAYAALRLASYYYFREAKFCATTWPDAGLLVRKDVLDPALLLHCDERMGLFLSARGQKQRLVLGLDDKPLVHHFSWVKTKAEMLQKVRSWAHHWERDWPTLIEEEFARPFNGKDFIRHYEYVETSAPFDPLLEQVPRLEAIGLEQHRHNLAAFPNVTRVTPVDIFRKDLSLTFNL